MYALDQNKYNLEKKEAPSKQPRQISWWTQATYVLALVGKH